MPQPIEPDQVWLGNSPGVKGRKIRITRVRDGIVGYEVIVTGSGRKSARARTHYELRDYSLRSNYVLLPAGIDG